MRTIALTMTMLVSLLAAVPAGAAGPLAGLLPADGEVGDWTTDGELRTYEPDNLWEYINGSAENFLAYEFEEVVARDYRDTEGRSLKVEIYRHASPLMAFGIFTQFRSPEAATLEIGDGAFGDEYSLHFWKGRHYVKIDTYDPGPETAAGMSGVARAVAEKMDGAGGPPAALAAFPPEGLVAGSETFINEGVLGSSKFPPAFTAEYAVGEAEGTLYLFPVKDAERARGVFDWYAGSIEATAEERGEAGGWLLAAGRDRYRGELLVFLRGEWLGIVTGFEGDARARENLARRAVERIAAAGCGE